MKLQHLFENVQYEQYIEPLKKILGIARRVLVSVGNPTDFDKGQNGATYFDTEAKAIQIVLNPQSEDIVRALCHEFVHAKQIDDGRLFLGKIRGQIVMQWEGQMVEPKYRRNSPWEIEAHTQEQSLFNQVTGRD